LRLKSTPADDRHLREHVLRKRLLDLLDRLIINLRPMQKHLDGQEYQPFNQEGSTIRGLVFDAIKASHLNSFDPALSIHCKFGGTLKREKKGMRDFTSLSLFRDDVECLLRDLYGDIESEALDSVLYAVDSIVGAFTRYARADLCEEYRDAVDLDYMLGIGLPKECGGIHGGDLYRGGRAKLNLMVRAYEVFAGPSAFSKYTVEFAKYFGEHWIVPNNDKEILEIKKKLRSPCAFWP
jgi:hypothetical protein